MAEDETDPEADTAEADDESGQNQYGGDSGDVDAVEQTERREADEDEPDAS